MKRTGWESRSLTGFSRVLSARLIGERAPMVPFFPDPQSTRHQNLFHPAPLKTAELCYGFLNHFKSGTHYFCCYVYSTFSSPPELLLLLISKLPFSTLKKKPQKKQLNEQKRQNMNIWSLITLLPSPPCHRRPSSGWRLCGWACCCRHCSCRCQSGLTGASLSHPSVRRSLCSDSWQRWRPTTPEPDSKQSPFLGLYDLIQAEGDY